MMPRFEPGDYNELGEPKSQNDAGLDDAPEIDPDPRPIGPTRLSGMALASLICGAVGCIPLIPSLFATVFGLIAMRETRRPGVAGRGMARVGLWLGILGVGGWGFLFYTAFNVYVTEEAKAHALCTKFVEDLANGKIDAALGRSIRDADRQPLEAASTAMKGLGPFNNIVPDLRMIPPSQRTPLIRWEVEADAVFSRGDLGVRLRLVQTGDSYLVERFEWTPPVKN